MNCTILQQTWLPLYHHTKFYNRHGSYSAIKQNSTTDMAPTPQSNKILQQTWLPLHNQTKFYNRYGSHSTIKQNSPTDIGPTLQSNKILQLAGSCSTIKQNSTLNRHGSYDSITQSNKKSETDITTSTNYSIHRIGTALTRRVHILAPTAGKTTQRTTPSRDALLYKSSVRGV